MSERKLTRRSRVTTGDPEHHVEPFFDIETAKLEAYGLIKEMLENKPSEKRTDREKAFLAAYSQGMTGREADAAFEVLRPRRPESRGRHAEMAANMINTWENFAKERLENSEWTCVTTRDSVSWRNGESSQDAPPNIPAARLLTAALESRMAIEMRLADVAFLLGVMFSRTILENGGPSKLLAAAASALQRERAKAARPKPLLGTRAIAVAWEEGHRDTESIRDFFNGWGGKKKDDEWGGLSLDAADDFAGWELIDEGAKAGKDGGKPTKAIKDASLPSMVSRFKKDRSRPS